MLSSWMSMDPGAILFYACLPLATDRSGFQQKFDCAATNSMRETALLALYIYGYLLLSAIFILLLRIILILKYR